MTLEEAQEVLNALVREGVDFNTVRLQDRADAARIREAFDLEES